MSIENPAQYQAASDFTQTIIARLATNRGVHAETAISAASRMAGTYVLRSCGLPLGQFAPGTSIFSDKGNEKGQQVLRTIDETLTDFGINYDASTIDYQIPPKNNPQMELYEIQSLLDKPLRAIAEKYDLSLEETAHVAALTAALLIQKCVTFLDPRVSYTIAVYGMVEACKTVPYAVAA